MGPLISEVQVMRVKSLIESAKKEGAKLLCGGELAKESKLKNGFFFMPSLLINCHEKMTIIKEEIFGPVITVEKFTSTKEALRLANQTKDRLSAGFWTEDEEKQRKLANELDFGTIWINDYNVYFPEAPWGGIKHSGLGRELGRLGYEEYTEIKHIYLNSSPKKLNYFAKDE